MKVVGRILVISGIAGAVDYFISKRHYSNELKEHQENEEKDKTAKNTENKDRENIGAENDKNKSVSSSNKDGDEDMERMFKNLKMTDEQRKRYEADYQVLNNTWVSENPDKTISDAERREQQEQTMKAVLDEAQYSSYREWFAEHHQDKN